MLLLVGLGNPGPGYANHRHNIGFMAVDAIARRHGFKPWRAKFEGEIAEGEVEGERVLALKPMTYMNLSGNAVAAAARFYKVPLASVIVVYDEIELAPGKVRVKQGGGNAGHNGLKSIDAAIGVDYRRVRLGVGRPERAVSEIDPEAVSNWVLRDFPKADRPWVEKLTEAVAENFPLLAAGNEDKFMNRVTLATKPAVPPKDEKKPSEN
ncbi:MAG: aminoacyl-tRNA hydrolase [Alphaproteobacteria bacterium]|nr:aminoacyl-tRNA hydrolase [Alphaproteobacteria bacterium]